MAIQTFLDFLSAYKGMASFVSLDQSQRKIVFYSEDARSIVHFEGIIRCLVDECGEEICYLTSDREDPILKNYHPKVKSFYVGHGLVRNLLFLKMNADLLIMTMPGLGTQYLKRSKVYPVHYLYMFHAMVSTHSTYRKGAFDNFDTIFCTGPYHVNEIRETEKIYGLPKKKLIEVGYGKLEVFMKEWEVQQKNSTTLSSGQKKILIAPSWGEGEILEFCGIELINILLEAGYQTIVRPHPMITKHKPRLINKISKKFKDSQNFQLNIDIQDENSIYESHLMISDWSGVAMEYAFASERPVLFIDVPQKCNNLEGGKISQVPIEVSIRNKIGRVVPVDKLPTLPKLIEDLCNDKGYFSAQIRKARRESVFNIGSSNKVATESILEIAKKQCQDNRNSTITPS